MTSTANDPNLPDWEWVNRVTFVIARLRERGLDAATILDVGGGTGNQLRALGLPNVQTLDLKPGSDYQASATDIPLEDDSVDAAVSMDTFEHFPALDRIQAFREMLRVARRAVIVAAPVDTEENRKAEEVVRRYVRNEFLEEHARFGLVDFEALRAIAAEQGNAEIALDPIDNLQTWVVLMTYGHAPPNRIYLEGSFLENAFHPRRQVLSVYFGAQ